MLQNLASYLVALDDLPGAAAAARKAILIQAERDLTMPTSPLLSSIWRSSSRCSAIVLERPYSKATPMPH